MNLTRHTTADAFDSLKPVWNDLVQRSTANTPFSTWEWQTAWWAAYHPGNLWVVTCENDAGKLVGIAPCFIETDGDTRTLRLIGHVDVTDYMDFIVDVDEQEAVYSELATYLSEAHGSDYDAIGLANIPEASPTYTAFPDVLRVQGFDVSFEENDVAPLIQLPQSYDDYLSNILDSKQRKEAKRKMRRAEGGEYEVAWYIVGSDHNLAEESERFLSLMAAADTEKAAFLQNGQHVDFFNRIVPLANDGGWLQLMFLTIDGNACAAYFNFDYNNRIYVYNSGLDPDNYGALSPGIVLTQYAIQHSIEQGRAVFDFLRGNETYKYLMGGSDTRVYQLNATKS